MAVSRTPPPSPGAPPPAELAAENASLRARIDELEAELARVEERRIAIAAVRQNPFDAVLVLARDRTVLFSNDVFSRDFEKAFGANVTRGARSVDATPVVMFEWFGDRFREAFQGQRPREALRIDLDGDVRHFDVTFVPLELDGAIHAVALFSRDVTAMVQTAEMLRATLDAAPTAVFALRPIRNASGAVVDFEITSCNVVGAEMVGRTREQLLGARVAHTEAGRLLRNDLAKVAETGDARDFDLRVPRSDVAAVPLCLHGRIARADELLVVCAADLSEREALRSRAALDDRIGSLGRLALGVAHELNNPLAFIRTNLEHVRDVIATDVSSRELASPVDEALAGMRRLERILDDLRAGTEPRPLDPWGIDLAPSVQAAVRTAAHALLPHARLDVRMAPDLPRVLADGGRLVQVLLNLLLNAGHAVRGAGRRGMVRVSAREVDDGVSVCVEDEGTGMDEAAVARAFEPFFTTRADAGGSGLGLWIGRSIVESFGGRIEIRSRPGVGTVVEVVLSVASGAPAPRPVEPSPRVASARLRILVIDDEELLRHALRRVLRGHEVVGEGHPRDALERVRRGERFDVVLCDLTLPDMHGLALIDALLELEPSLTGHIVAMSGGAGHEVEVALELRGVELIAKPFDAERLREVIERVALRRASS